MKNENPQVFNAEIQASVDANYKKIMSGDGGTFFHQAVPKRLADIVEAKASYRDKYFALLDVSKKIGKRLGPNSACTKNCSHCCHMSVTLLGYEAEMLGSLIGIKPKEVPITNIMKETKEETEEFLVDRWMGVDCVFLKDGKCSIYDYRPFACRNYYNLSHDETLCDLTKGRQDVPAMDLSMFWGAAAYVYAETGLGDIRDYFPDGLAGKETA